MSVSVETQHAAGAAFDVVAPRYDALFTFSMVGRSQRNAVWRQMASIFQPGQRVLELNCGTGEDALFLARNGVAVTACDASEQMIARARARKAEESPDAPIRFVVLPNEELRELPDCTPFDGALSNFSGLNCIEDLSAIATEVACRLRPGARFLFCLSPRCCIWEIAYFAAQGKFRKALRRLSGRSVARFGPVSFHVYYPTVRSLRSIFEPEFRLRAVRGVGITVPPSYLESWMAKHPALLAVLERLDAALCDWPLFRGIGDHVLLEWERVQP